MRFSFTVCIPFPWRSISSLSLLLSPLPFHSASFVIFKAAGSSTANSRNLPLVLIIQDSPPIDNETPQSFHLHLSSIYDRLIHIRQNNICAPPSLHYGQTRSRSWRKNLTAPIRLNPWRAYLRKLYPHSFSRVKKIPHIICGTPSGF